MGKQKKEFRVAAIFDTETTTLGAGKTARAFAWAYIVNDLRDVDITTYESPRDDSITIYRTAPEMLAFVDALIEWGRDNALIPVVCAYNQMFDLATLRAALADAYTCQVTAQTSTHVYVFDLCDEAGNKLLRFWDTFFLEMSGLAAMGETAGLPKAVGDLDYSCVRTPETPITAQEAHYMRRDVQVIPAYLRWLTETNEWMNPADLGFRVLTKSGIVRQMALHKFFNLKIPGKTYTVGHAFEILCSQELPPDYETMALRTACFRGGFTFTAARTAMVPVRRVGSWDVTSMHHQYLNGRRLPVRFHACTPMQLQLAAQGVARITRERVLANYASPFPLAFNGVFEFTNIRLKTGSAFEFYGIALLAESKFRNKEAVDLESNLGAHPGNEANIAADNAVKAAGYIDEARGATFAFGKLYAARTAQLCLTEVEFWNVCRVYDFDSFKAIGGELTSKTELPPDYVSLQSNVLFEQKSEVKHIMNTYEPGKPYVAEIPSGVPTNIAEGLRSGSLSATFMKGYYNVATKGSFNALYGIQAMQLWRPDFEVTEAGDVRLDACTVPSADNFGDRAPKQPRSIYTYGARIVGGSRQHLVIAMELIYEVFGEKALITGGDTDSMKIALAENIEPEDITAALEPLHAACRAAKALVQRRVRANYPELASELKDIGEFDFEPATKDGPRLYEEHMEFWNKARVSFVAGHTHITFAGMSRPERPDDFEGVAYNIEELMDALIAKGYKFEEVAKACCGYNASISPRVGHALMRKLPKASDRICEDVRDYTGQTAHVDAPQAQALYPVWKTVGDLGKFTNAASAAYLARVYNREVDDLDKFVDADPDNNFAPRVTIGYSEPRIME